MAQNLAIIGAQWGDEGKGKVVDLLCSDFDVVARFQGGHNAGHTVRFGEKHFALRLIPSGILHADKLCVLGNGMVIDPQALLSEMAELEKNGVDFGDRLKISESAHCILPIHKAVDLAREEAAGEGKIGTTGRGIGPTYESKMSRYGVLVGELLDEKVLRQKVKAVCAEKNALLKFYGKEPIDPETIVVDYLKFGETLRHRITDTTVLVNDAIAKGRRVMFEGAQGSLLDIDHGTYPFVTSSSCVTGGICIGLGVAPKQIHRVMAVVKAYTTRVGGGPFPSELTDATGDKIRERGNEFGTVTGRPRRIGWLDLVVLRTSAMLSGIDEIALTKLDVLDDFEEISVCVAYETADGGETRTYPKLAANAGRVKPKLVTLPGWKTSIVGMSSIDQLPANARAYVDFIEKELGIPIPIISTGPRREETIIR